MKKQILADWGPDQLVNAKRGGVKLSTRPRLLKGWITLSTK